MASSLAADAPSLTSLQQILVDEANAQHESEAYQRLFSVPLSFARVRAHHLQKAIWVLNRRECWAYAQAKAPFDVKQLIWQHEQEELDGDVTRGLENHYALNVKQGEALGLGPEDFANVKATDTTMTCLYAWVNLVKDSPWLKSFAACAALEITNSDEILRGKSASRRMAEKIQDELGIEMSRQQSFNEHVVADIEHAHILMIAAKDHVRTELDHAQVLEGVRESWAIDRVFRAHLADLMESIAD
jgi:hypothetical protein